MNEDNSSGLIPVTDHELFQATTARGFEPGQTIFNRFVLTRVLGRGGMGIVWLAQDTQLEQEVAIKVLPDVVMHDREAVGDMKRETKRSLQLNHHNIVRIYDFNQDEKGAGISMEFVDGETLSAAKTDRPHGCFDVEDIAPWVEQICDALAYAHHTAKIVHRDLKPANIMLSKNNTIKVTDFGIARSISDSVSRVSMRHASSGTMVYMSPQQSTGARSSASDDIYALGATIYDLLTGKPPFYSGNIQHQLETITPPRMAERRLELERHGNPIPEVWERVVASCLEKEPGRRPGSVVELAQMLNLRTTTVTTTSPVRATTPPSLERTIVDASPPTTPYFPPPAPPEPSAPRPPFFTPARLMIGGGVAAAIVFVALVVGLISFLSRGHGSVSVASVPPGATASIGGTKLTTPATFDQVPSGDATVNLVLNGYDPMEIPAKVTKGDRTDIPLVMLTRSTGIIAVTVVPPRATCTLRMVQPDVAGEGAGEIASFPRLRAVAVAAAENRHLRIGHLRRRPARGPRRNPGQARRHAADRRRPGQGSRGQGSRSGGTRRGEFRGAAAGQIPRRRGGQDAPDGLLSAGVRGLP
ncbi:MAG: serine/threonine-protein kinase [Verrucomicrobiota bacterium]